MHPTGFIYNYTEGTLAPPSSPNEKSVIGLVINEINPEFLCPMLYGTMSSFTLYADYNFSYYKLSSVWKYLNKITEILYDANGLNPLTNITNY